MSKSPSGLVLPDLILLGPPGSGKGTQANLLKERFGYQLLAIGDLLRARTKRTDPTTRELKEALASGRLIDDAQTEVILTESLSEGDANSPVVFDGFPRRPSQLPVLLRLRHLRDHRATLLIVLDIPDEIAIDRLRDRKVCASCGHIGRKDEVVCRVCAGSMIDRTDNRVEVHRDRLALYRANEGILLKELGETYPVYKFDADRPPQTIFADLTEAITQPVRKSQ